MLKTFPIDFVRAVFEWKLKSYSTNINYFNNEDISLFSFYEHLATQEEVDRYVERYNDLIDQQNRSNSLGVGVITITDTPSLTNISSSFVSPFEWSCTIRCTMANRDKMMQTIYKLIADLKGRKVDVAQLDSGKLFPVGTLLNNNESDMKIQENDFIGSVTYSQESGIDSAITGVLTNLSANGITYNYPQNEDGVVIIAEHTNVGQLKTYLYDNGGGIFIETEKNEIPPHTSFEKYKLDLSFDDIKVDEPFTLDAQEYCTITFSGSATLCNNSIRVGNDLVRLYFSKYKVKGASDYTFSTNSYRLEPLELPSNSNANIIQNQLRSNYFRTNTHTDSLALSIQYSFLCDLSNTLISQWFDYARYGENSLDASNVLTINSITPNIIYSVNEYWVSWGEVSKKSFKAKIVDDISIENTESDVLTLGLSMQIQGEND